MNPRHLFLGTNKDNILDARDKNRLNRQGRAKTNGKLTNEQVIKMRLEFSLGEAR
jgi:hypothetical protein